MTHHLVLTQEAIHAAAEALHRHHSDEYGDSLTWIDFTAAAHEALQAAAPALANATATDTPDQLQHADWSHTLRGLKIWELGEDGDHIIATGHVDKEWMAAAVLALWEDTCSPLPKVELADVRHTTARIEDDPTGRFDWITRTGDNLDFNVTEWRAGSGDATAETAR